MVDIIVPQNIIREGQNVTLILKYLTTIDPATGWFIIVRYNYKYASTIENLVEKTWLCIYPMAERITYDFRNEFLGHAF